MSTIIRFLPAAACVGAMVFCMRGMFGRNNTDATDPRAAEVKRLREELAELRSRLDASDASNVGDRR